MAEDAITLHRVVYEVWDLKQVAKQQTNIYAMFSTVQSPYSRSVVQFNACMHAAVSGGFLENICTGMLKVDFRMLTISIPVYCKKKHPITIPHLYD